MSIKKRIIICASVFVVLSALANFLGAQIIKHTVGESLCESYYGYTKRSQGMLHPGFDELEGKEARTGRCDMFMRSLLDDSRLRNQNDNFLYNFIFLNFDVDISTVFMDRDGMNEFSKGIFAAVIDEDIDTEGSKIDMVKTIGLMDMNELAKADCAEDISGLLKEDGRRKIRVDGYRRENYMIKPAKLTVLEPDGTEAASFDIPCSGETVTSQSCYIHDDFIYTDSDGDIVQSGIYNKLRDAKLGERSTDRRAKELAAMDVFGNGDGGDVRTTMGLCSYTAEFTEVEGDDAMICVMRFNYIKGWVLYTAIFFVQALLVIVLGGRKKR